MAVKPLVFNGAEIVRPGYYAKRNIEAGGRVGGVPLNSIVIIGKCEGGTPQSASVPDEEKIMFFGGSPDARSVMRRGDALDASLLSFFATPDVRINPGANEVGVIRVNPATKSTKNLNNTDAAVALKVDSVDYGLHTTGIAINVSDGTTGKLLEVRKDNVTISNDNVERPVIDVQYVGDGTTATLTKTATQITTTLAGDQTDGSANLTIDLSVSETAQAVVDYINSQVGYTASLNNPEFGESSSKELDVVSAIDIKTAVATLKADAQAAIDSFNAIGLVDVSIIDEAQRKPLENLADFEFLTGGVEGTTTMQSWIDALELAIKQNFWLVVVLSDDSSVHQLLVSHVEEANGVKGRKERRGLTGAGVSDDDATIKNKAALINSSFVGFYGPADYRFDSTGTEVKTPGYIWSAAIAGMTAPNDPTTPLTHKSIRITKAAKTYTNREIEQFIKAGVMLSTPIPGGGGFRIERSVTTYQGSNLIANEWSIMGTILAITAEHRLRLDERFIGLAGTAQAKELLESYSIEVLEEFLERGWFTENADTGEVAISNHKVVVEGDTYKISYDGIVTAPINFIPATHNFTLLGLGSP